MALETELGQLINIMNPYSNPGSGFPYPNPMDFSGLNAPQGQASPLAAFNMEIDNYKGEWSFRGNPETIKRALRITYRYPVVDQNGNLTGAWATEHLLIGYAGGNS